MIKILERIDLRSARDDKKKLLLQLEELVNFVSEKTKSDKIKIYTHYNIGTDYSIHLHRTISHEEHLESELGVRLASSLKEFGLVNHSVWIETIGRN
jgi:hypothetical protein